MWEKDPLTEPWKPGGMDQLCSKLPPEADKGCTDAGGPAPVRRGTPPHREQEPFSRFRPVCVQTCSQGVSAAPEPLRELVPIPLLQLEKGNRSLELFKKKKTMREAKEELVYH